MLDSRTASTETSSLVDRSAENSDDPVYDVLDYRVYERVPRWWRKCEQWLGLDLYLARRAKRIERQYDLIWAASERVAVPLSLFGLQRPLVVVTHHPESSLKAKFVRLFRLSNSWSAVGYISNESRSFLIDRWRVPPERVFQAESAKYLYRQSKDAPKDGSILSVGANRRDYRTLIAALSKLPDYDTDIYPSSKFGEALPERIDSTVAEWIHLREFVPEEELIARYQRARFVVVPLMATTHGGAGATAVLEASACGKAVIATRTGGMPTFVKDGETGILVPPNDVDALRSAIQKLWEQPQLAREMGLAGWRYMEAQFNPHKVQRNLDELLKRIVADQQSQ